MLGGGEAGVFHALAAGAERAVDNVADQVIEECAGDFTAVLSALPVEFDLYRVRERQRFFGSDHRLTQRLYGFA